MYDIFLLRDSIQYFFNSQMIRPADLVHPSAAPHFKTFQVLHDLPSEVSKFQHHKSLCSKCSILLISALNLSPISHTKREHMTAEV